ncbi:MAG TPA: type II toxin-antitoxin system VapC family toxin [Chloroflexota bacterium]|nr:type II toxin-antitoxin system VapC family toxin [Chloroflexota bacterium]
MICIDASVAAKWLFAEEHSERARALYRRASIAAERMIAPPLLPIEVTNIVRQRMRSAKPPDQGLLSLNEAREALALLESFPIEISAPNQLCRQAFEIAVAHGLPAVYDAQYIALAELLDCALWTADQNLVNAVKGKLSFVHWIGNYDPG